jgi:6-pyruvoyl-tetrahydropterin synthase
VYSITVSHHFMIAHSLVGTVFGPAQQLHGATFVVEAELRRDALDADGIVCDIGRALDLLKTVLAEFDYRNSTSSPNSAGAIPQPSSSPSKSTPSGWCGGSKKVRSGLRPSPLQSSTAENPVAWAAYDAPLG